LTHPRHRWQAPVIIKTESCHDAHEAIHWWNDHHHIVAIAVYQADMRNTPDVPEGHSTLPLQN